MGKLEEVLDQQTMAGAVAVVAKEVTALSKRRAELAAQLRGIATGIQTEENKYIELERQLHATEGEIYNKSPNLTS
jgi:hypothetical protein